MTERTRLISSLLFGLFSAIRKRIPSMKAPEIVFHIRLCALWLSSSLTLKKYLCQFFFQLLKIQLYFVHLFCCFRPRAPSFTHNSKEPSSREKNLIMPGHYKKIMPAQQPIRARVLLLPYNKQQSEFTIYLVRQNHESVGDSQKSCGKILAGRLIFQKAFLVPPNFLSCFYDSAKTPYLLYPLHLNTCSNHLDFVQVRPHEFQGRIAK